MPSRERGGRRMLGKRSQTEPDNFWPRRLRTEAAAVYPQPLSQHRTGCGAVAPGAADDRRVRV